MQSINITIEGRSVELYFSTRAMINISERCGGDIAKLGEWLSEGAASVQLGKICDVMGELANGAVIKHNADLTLGIGSGAKWPLYPDGYFIDVLQPSQLIEYRENIFNALNLGNDVEIPEGIEVKETDNDLEEIKAEREKKD